MEIVILKAKSRHGKNRIKQHGERWRVKELKPHKWRPNSRSEWRDWEPEPNTVLLESIDCACPTCEKFGQDWRWIDIRNDSNFEILRRETIDS